MRITKHIEALGQGADCNEADWGGPILPIYLPLETLRRAVQTLRV